LTTEVGLVLPELVIDVTPTFVISTAIATRDFQDVHHDRDRAVERGGKDIFVNILTTTGLVQRYVTDWAGPQAVVRRIALRLGAPCYAGDTLTFSGRVVEGAGGGQRAGGEPGEGAGREQRADAEPGEGAVREQRADAEQGEGAGGQLTGGAGEEYVVEVVGRCSLGDHVTGTVRIAAPGSAA
jgi:acyl dehydratase